MRTATLVTTVTLVLLGTITFAQSVTYDFDRSANFSSFRTYAWVRGAELTDELNHARVVRSIERQLASKGLTKVEASANPDVLVAYHASFDRNLQINAYSSGWGGPRFGGLRSGTATTQEILTGTLVVDMMDASTKSIVWRGMASGDIDPSAKPEKREKNINKATQKLFKNYPPKRGVRLSGRTHPLVRGSVAHGVDLRRIARRSGSSSAIAQRASTAVDEFASELGAAVAVGLRAALDRVVRGAAAGAGDPSVAGLHWQVADT